MEWPIQRYVGWEDIIFPLVGESGGPPLAVGGPRKSFTTEGPGWSGTEEVAVGRPLLLRGELQLAQAGSVSTSPCGHLP